MISEQIEYLMNIHLQMSQNLRILTKENKHDYRSVLQRKRIKIHMREVEKRLLTYVPRTFEPLTFSGYARKN